MEDEELDSGLITEIINGDVDEEEEEDISFLEPSLLNIDNDNYNLYTSTDSEIENEEMVIISEDIDDVDNIDNKRKNNKLSSGTRKLIPEQRFLYIFPDWLEKKFSPFDDPIIKLCQFSTNKIFTFISLLITLFFTIELIIMAPVTLLMLGYDEQAYIIMWIGLISSTITQIPKRFIWRFRPWMVDRAKMVRKTKTSSFPSRAVSCSVIYTFVFIYVLNYSIYETEKALFYQIILLFPLCVLGSSFARVNLGVHYPSDCVFGIVQGTISSLLGFLVWKVNILGCESCKIYNNDEYDSASIDKDQYCYTNKGSSLTNTANFFSSINYITLSVGLLLCLLIAGLSIVKPIQFWHKKCERTYGLILPCILFHILFLCPNGNSSHTSLSQPESSPLLYYIPAILYPLLVIAVAQKLKSRYAFISFLVIFIITFVGLILWRLFVLKTIL